MQNNVNRVYDPLTARWLSKDPIRVGGGDANFYRYCGDSPTRWRDPSGLCREAPSMHYPGWQPGMPTTEPYWLRRPEPPVMPKDQESLLADLLASGHPFLAIGMPGGLGENALVVIGAGAGGAGGNPFPGLWTPSKGPTPPPPPPPQEPPPDRGGRGPGGPGRGPDLDPCFTPPGSLGGQQNLPKPGSPAKPADPVNRAPLYPLAP